MKVITTFIAFVTAIASMCVFAGGACYAYGWALPSYILTAIGAGWLGIIYSALLRMLGAHD